MNPTNRISLADIARKVNVSTATVSYVLNKRESQMISPATRDKVLAAARELGYRPNRAAQALAGRRSFLVELFVYGYYPAFYGLALHEFEQQIGPTPYQLHIVNPSHWTDETWEEAESGWPVDGVIIFDAALPNQAIEAMQKRGVPVVSVGINPALHLDHIKIDLAPALHGAMQHLMARSKRVAFYSPWELERSRRNKDPRYQAYRDAMKSLNRAEELIVSPELSGLATRAAARQCVHDFIAKNGCPDAIFCFNDERAIATLAALRDLRIRVPQDVLLIGCDGIEETAFHSPAISTIAYPLAETARLAWDFLQRRIENPDTPPQIATLTAKLELSESSER